jgi:cbb3-type cytochrome oxidase subunit 3
MKEKARRAAAFLFWYSQTSLLEVRFALTLHAWTTLSPFLCSMLFFYFYLQPKKKKKRGGERCRYLFPYLAFQLSYVFLPDLSVLGTLIIFAFI